MGYTAFISYSHAEDHTLAAALESALLRFAWPVPGETAMRLFRDSSSLSATPELWPTIQKALDESEFLLLIASEEAARSVWVRREVQHWRTRGGAGRLLIALAGGAIVWHAGREDFDLTRSTALPSSIAGAFATEPLYVDFSTVLPRHYDLNHPAFCDKVATIASSLRGVTKDMLFGIHISRRLATEAARLSAEAELALRDGLPERSLMLGATALRLLDDRGQPRSCAAESIVRSALRRFGGRPLGSLLSAAIEPPLAFDNNGRWLVTIDTSGRTSAFELHGRTTEGQPIALDHDGPVAAVEFTADGGWLVSQWISSETGAAAGRTIRLWNAPSGFAEWHDVTAPEGKAFAIAVLSAERTHLAAGCDDGTIRVWDLEKGAGGDPLVVLDAGDAISHLACAARQHRVAALTAGGSLYVWDLGDDQPAGTHSKIPLPESARIFHLAFSPDARWLLCRGETSLLVSMRRGENPRSWLELTAYRGRIWKHVFSPDGLWLATATGPTAYEELLTAYYPESTVRLWDLHRLKSWDLIGHDDVACDVAMTSDGNGVISASLDRTIRVWDFSALRRFQQQRIEAAATGDTSWSAGVPGGDIDAHESYAAQQAFRQHKTLLGGEMAVFHCVPSPDGSWLATVPMGKSASARLWRMNHGDGAAPIHVPKFVVPSQLAEISPAQKWFFFAAAGQASGGAAEFSANREWLLLWAEQHLLVFDVLHDRAEPHWTLDAQFESAHLSPDARWVAIRSQSKVVLADVNDSSRYRNVVSDIGPIQKVQCSPCGRWLITVEGESVCIRDLRRDDLTGAAAVIPTTGGEVPNIAIDPDGRLLLAGNRASATIWQLDEAGRASVFMELSGHGAEPGGVDGRFLARGRWLVTRDVARLQVWDLATRQRRLEVVEGSLKVGFAVDLTSDDRWLVVSQYGRVRLFDMHDPGAAPVTVREFAGGQIRFAISPDSRWLVTADSPIDTPLGRAGGLSVRVHDLWAPNVAESAVDLPGLDREPQRVQISWDSRWLATTGTELLLWPLGVPHLLDLAIETAGRDFTEEERRRYQID